MDKVKLSWIIRDISAQLCWFVDGWVINPLPTEYSTVEAIQEATGNNFSISKGIYIDMVDGDGVKAFIKLGLSVDEVDLILPKFTDIRLKYADDIVPEFDEFLYEVSNCLEEEGL